MSDQYYLNKHDREIIQDTVDTVANTPSGRLVRRNRRNRTISGVTSFSGYDFEASYESDGTITIAAGNIITGLTNLLTVESSVSLDLSEDGLHCVYIQVWHEYTPLSTWLYSYHEKVGRPSQNDDSLAVPVYQKTIAKVAVSGSEIVAFAQNHIGELDIPRIT